jgi:hypothetical protein
MSDLASAAAGSVDWVARWTAFAGLAISFISVAVTLYVFRRSGWRLRIDVVTQYGVDDKGRYILRDRNVGIAVTNVGRLPCVVRDVQVRISGGLLTAEGHINTVPTAVVAVQLPGEVSQVTLVPSETVTAQLEIEAALLDLDRFRIQGFAWSGRRWIGSGAPNWVYSRPN